MEPNFVMGMLNLFLSGVLKRFIREFSYLVDTFW